MLNEMCKNCLCLGKDCNGTENQVRTGCIYRKTVKDLEKMADEALRQIAEKQYAAELNDDGYDIIGNYGIAFCGKDCLVKYQA